MIIEREDRLTQAAVIVSPVPFHSSAVREMLAPAGTTVRALLARAAEEGVLPADDLARTLPRTRVLVDGRVLDRETALDHRIAASESVNIEVAPMGDGGGGGKDVGQILLTIAVIAVSAWVGGPAGAGLGLKNALLRTVASATVMVLGQAAIGALFAPDTDGKAAANDRYALQSASNQYRPWSPFPLALGEVIAAPDLAVKTFTRAIGDDVWIYGMLGVHYGACQVDDLKVGDTLASSMGAADAQFVHHLTPGPRTFSLCPNDIDQLDLQEELQKDGTAVVRVASSEGELFEFDFFLPAGLHFQKDDGRILTASVTLSVRYRPVDEDGEPTGGGGWSAGLTAPLTSTTKEPWRLTRALSLPLGRYEFEVRRSLPDDANDSRKDQVALTAIRSIAYRKPVTDETLAVIEFAIRATALNQGTLAPLTCRIRPVVETWTGSAWGAPAPTSNPAAIARWLLTGPAPARPLPSLQADVGLRDWSLLCDAYDWTANIYLTEAKTQAEVLGLLEQAGRASLYWDGSRIVAAPWVEKPLPRQLFTGPNLRDHRWQIAYPEPVHALRVEFQNLDQGGEPDELYVYNDGYAETMGGGLAAATLVEALRVEGQKTDERAYRDGRWELGRRLHRRRVDTWTTDIEHLVARYGDRVRLSWQRLDAGASARVLCRRWSGSQVTGLRLTQPVTFEPGEDYAVDLRLTDSVQAAVAVVNPATSGPVTTREIVFASARGAEVSPRARDLIAFGASTRVSEDVEIVGIEPGEGLTATLTGVRYVAPLLMAGETGPIPPLQTRLTRQRSLNPPAPTLLGLQVEETGIRVGFAMPPWAGSPITGFECRWRPKPALGQSVGWTMLPPLGAGAMTLTTPPLREAPVENLANPEAEITQVEIEIRAQTVSGRVSPPLTVTAGKSVAPQPLESDWSVTPRGPDPDGSQQPGLTVIRLSQGILTPGVIIEYAVQNGDPWTPAYSGPATLPRYDITGLQAGVDHWVSITNVSAQGVPSARRIYGPFDPGALIAAALDAAARADLLDDLAAMVDGSEAAQRVAETLLEAVLTEQESHEKEAADRLAADTGVLNEATSRAEAALAEAMNTVYTRAETDLGLASTLQFARSYTDETQQEAELLFATKAERADGDASSLLQAKSYTDAYKSEADLTFATQAALGSGLAATLTAAQSFATGEVSSAMATVYTKAQSDTLFASTLSSAESYTDAYKTVASATFATKVTVNGLSGTVAAVQSATATIDGKVELIYGFALDNNGRVNGMRAADDGTVANLDFIFDKIRFWTGSQVRPLLTLESGQVVVNGNLVVTSSVQDNAITGAMAAYTSFIMYLSGTGETTVQSLSYVSTGKPIEIRANYYAAFWHPAGGGFNLTQRIRRNGTEIFNLSIAAINGDRIDGWQTPEITDQPGAGTWTYTATVQLSTDDGFDLRTVSSRRLSAREFKK